jgi:hypothetical protein
VHTCKCDREPWDESKNVVSVSSKSGQPLAESTSLEARVVPETDSPGIIATESIENQIKNDTTKDHLDNADVLKQDLNKDSPSDIQNQRFTTENKSSSSLLPPSLDVSNGPTCDMKFEADLFPPIYDLLGVISVAFYYLCGYFALLMPYWL